MVSNRALPARVYGKPFSIKRAFWAFAILFILFPGVPVLAQESSIQKQSIQSQIDALEKEVADIDGKLQETQKQSTSLNREVTIFNNEIKKKELELQRISLAIRQANIDIANTSVKIGDVVQDVEKNRKLLVKNIQQLYKYDQENLVAIVAKNNSLSDFFLTVNSIRSLQASTDELITQLRQERKQLEVQKTDLQDFREEQQSLEALQKIQKRDLALQKQEKDKLLAETKGKESVFQSLLKTKKQNLAQLKTQLFYLEKTGVAAEDAVRFAELAASRTGIRTEFLLALLEVETGKNFEEGVITAGTHLGSGNWKTDMYNCYINLGKRSAAEAQKNAFFAITAKLNLNPDDMPVSRRPNYGCGGAMGPAQFIPTTWLLFEKRVLELTGHNPANPWNIEDAFTAAAIFLADSGAVLRTTDGEMRAARTYISGKASCPASGSARVACLGYARRIADLTIKIGKII
ncbi:MAG: lytic murein transglycosylase [bacterium]|nr:lytic murein transglycosylase [bacterium]